MSCPGIRRGPPFLRRRTRCPISLPGIGGGPHANGAGGAAHVTPRHRGRARPPIHNPGLRRGPPFFTPPGAPYITLRNTGHMGARWPPSPTIRPSPYSGGPPIPTGRRGAPPHVMSRNPGLRRGPPFLRRRAPPCVTPPAIAGGPLCHHLRPIQPSNSLSTLTLTTFCAADLSNLTSITGLSSVSCD